MNKISIDLIRHGDAAGGKKLLGKTDEPLSELGWNQLRAIIQQSSLPWQTIISSPLQRCLSFSTAIAEQHSLPISITHQFQEIDFGTWDGRLLTDLYKGEEAEYLSQFMQSPSSITPPNGESYQEFKCRILSAWHDLLQSLHHAEINHAVLVTHAGVIRTILSHILDFPEESLFRLDVPYGCLSRITQYENYPPVLNFHGGSL